MRTHVVDHPLVAHKLTTLRDETTDSPTFRRLADELVTLLAYEATRDVRVAAIDIVTPVAPTTGVKLASPKPLVVPILRAGLGMLDGMMRLLPTAEVGFLGMVRNEETLEASTYAERLPDDLSGRQCYVLDPMLATGGTLAAAIRFLADRGADDITAICLLAAPEGCARLEQELADLDVPVTIVTAAMDEKLNDKGYIVPGLGDAGDRLYGASAIGLPPRGGAARPAARAGRPFGRLAVTVVPTPSLEEIEMSPPWSVDDGLHDRRAPGRCPGSPAVWRSRRGRSG